MGKTPIALMLTDTHLHDGNIELVTDIFDQAIQVCKDRGIKNMFHLGDWFTSRKSQSQGVLLATRNIINKIAETDIFFIAIKGNHDAVEADSENSFLDVFDSPYFSVIKKEQSIPFDGLSVHFLPYFKESGSYLERLNNLPKDQKAVILTHAGITGVRNNDYTVVQNDVAPDLFSKYIACFSGHYHDQDKIKDNIYYIGSAYQANYGEDTKKGFTALYNDGSHEFFKSKFTEFTTVKLDIKDEKAIKEAQKQYKDSDDHVRFVFSGEEAELKTVSKEKFAALGISVEFKKDSAVPLEVSDLVEKAKGLSFDRSNIISAFDLFCQTKHIEDNSIGKQYLDKI